MKTFVTPISKLNNSLYLSWAFELNVDWFKDGPLVLAPKTTAMASQLLILAVPTSDIARPASIVICMIAWVIIYAFSISLSL